MILIADSGSTKTSWRLIDSENNLTQFKCVGLNPYIMDQNAIIEELRNTFTNVSTLEISQIYFYGSGCSTDSAKTKIREALLEIFKKANATVEGDMLGAARAACGKEAGIACILGTGSNSCFYDGAEIKEQISSSGFILGDEGSGVAMGKILLGDFIRKEMPENLQNKLEKRFELNKDKILESVYRKERPNKYIAQFSKFIFQNLDQPYCQNLVIRCFDEFFLKYICKYPEHKNHRIHFVGSIAFYFNSYLRKVARKHNISIGNILEEPIAGLTLYHTSL